MVLPVTITLSFIFFYTVVMSLLLSGLVRLRGAAREERIPGGKVTVVIPFRNEADHLPGLLEDLLRQTCPAPQFSVILVNDHSSDGSRDLVADMIKERSGITCLDLPVGKEGKKEALAHAISAVQTSWIIQMDADCSIDPGFVEAHILFIENNPADLVAGFVTTRQGKGSFLEAFERLDMLSLAGAGAGSFHYRRPLMCSGANLLYNKSLYMDTRKFDPVDRTASGDDMFLLIGARKLNRKISFNPGIRSVVQTSATRHFGMLVRQRIRWGSKSVYYQVADLKLVAILVALSNLMILLTPVWATIFPGSLWWLLPAIGIKTCIDFLVLFVTTGYTGQRKSLWWFLPVSAVYYPYMAVVITGSLLGRSSWKGRTY